jgi:hypothetical protein
MPAPAGLSHDAESGNRSQAAGLTRSPRDRGSAGTRGGQCAHRRVAPRELPSRAERRLGVGRPGRVGTDGPSSGVPGGGSPPVSRVPSRTDLLCIWDEDHARLGPLAATPDGAQAARARIQGPPYRRQQARSTNPQIASIRPVHDAIRPVPGHETDALSYFEGEAGLIFTARWHGA